MNITVVTVAFKSGENIKNLVETAYENSSNNISFIIFQNSTQADVEESCVNARAKYDAALYQRRKNESIASAWNHGMFEAYDGNADVVIITGDDVTVEPGGFDDLAAKAVGNPDRYMVSCGGWHIGHNQFEKTHGYGCFAINPIALDKIGCFDENFKPAYLEDCDHHRRATLLGLVEENVPSNCIRHYGSYSVTIDPEFRVKNLATQRLNGIYYISKWGGLNGQERLSKPFGRFGLKIPYDLRRTPYGEGYDRA